MLLFAEIVIEVLMIAAVVVAVGALVHLLQLSVREQVYLRSLRRDRETAETALVTSPKPQKRHAAAVRVKPETGGLFLSQRHV
jgi:hypothetical protein